MIPGFSALCRVCVLGAGAVPLLLATLSTGLQAAPETNQLLYPVSYEQCLQSGQPVLTRTNIYHEGWIDLNKNGRKDPYEDASLPVDQRVKDLLKRMSLEEKTAQMATIYGYGRVLKEALPTTGWRSAFWKDGVANIDEHLTGHPYALKNVYGTNFMWPASKHTWALNEVQRFFIEETRLGVPAEFTDEGVRGVDHFKATCFPTQLALGQTWDRALIHQIGQIEGQEAWNLGFDNIYAPILDVMRDPRWGRCEESYGEDPFLVSELAIQMVRGIQSQGVVSTLKHFCLYANNKGAREGASRTDPHCPPREAEMIHLWPWERVIRQANPLGAMSSYNDYDGTPITGSRYFLTEVLRQRFGFQGYVVSDSDAVEFLASKHHVTSDYKEAVRLSVLAGLNVRTTFTPPDVFVNPLRELVREKAIPMRLLEERVGDVLRVKFREGLFDQPYRPLTHADAVVMSPEHVAVARQAARECLVLLKNENHLLPLRAEGLHTIALCGPNADNPNYARGRYGPGQEPVVTVRAALEERFAGKATILYTKGCEHLDARWPETEIMREAPTAAEQAELDQAAANARQAEVVIVVTGDMPRGAAGVRATVGEDSSRTGLDLTGRQDDLIRAVAASGKPVIVVDISGRPVALNWANRLCPAILQAFFPGMEGGHAIVEALVGDTNPAGKLTCSFPKTAGQLELNFPTKPGANAEPTNATRVNVAGLLWPFGHGLSYTTFGYSDLKITPARQKAAGTIEVAFKLSNTGPCAGDEVPQLYLHQQVSSVTTYEQNLRGFERVHLEPGQSREVCFTVTPESLMLWNAQLQRVVEPGRFSVQIGSSCTDIRLQGEFEIVGAPLRQEKLSSLP